MKYMLLLHEPDTDWASVPQQELDKALAEHAEFIQYLTARGRPFSGEALRPSYTATTLRPKGDEVLVTDGPFVELKEHIGGFYVIEADTLDEAIEVAKHVPLGSGVEIRPIWDA
ncbi:YciI family protein [Kibdelosporangium philippinense]|uniref:YciI family protein n=1 Tax=Kibdelosporangium philippinense TaxID=211113 RepID=A0ABS8ZCN1_9PSEU|nr:YciI family protein [Kibdelosporangium philippinense]MCE7005616.1 YciI family protein [Kibdelosporangium philippinense]